MDKPVEWLTSRGYTVRLLEAGVVWCGRGEQAFTFGSLEEAVGIITRIEQIKEMIGDRHGKTEKG